MSGQGITTSGGAGSVASTDITDSTATGRSLITATDAAAGRTALSLGTAAVAATGDFATAAQGTKADAALPATSRTPLLVAFQSDQLTRAWTNMPAADTVLFALATCLRRADLTNYTQVRFVHGNYSGYVAGYAGSTLRLAYAAASTFSVAAGSYTDISASSTAIALDTGTSQWSTTGWVDLAAGAKADVTLAVIGSGGDGVVDPTIGYLYAEFK